MVRNFNYVNRGDKCLMMKNKNNELNSIIKPIPESYYCVDIGLNFLNTHLAELDEDAKSDGGRLILNPDFQRGHVWTKEQQIHYVENLFRGIAPIEVRFNQGGWMEWNNSIKNENKDIVCIDGLQRITAVQSFLNNDFKIFGKLNVDDLDGTTYSCKRIGYRLKFRMHSIRSRRELLKLYIDLNSGGTPHSSKEIDRVKNLMEVTK